MNEVDVEAEQAELDEDADSQPRLADVLRAMQDLADENDGDQTAEAGDPR